MDAGWQPDPMGRHQERWFDGVDWTAQVRDHGVVNTDGAGLPGGGTGGMSGPGLSGAPPGGGSRPAGGGFGVIAPGGSLPGPGPVGAPPPPGGVPYAPGSAASDPGLSGGVPMVPVATHIPAAGSSSAGRVPPTAYPAGAGSQGGLAVLGKNSIVSGAIAGAIGGGLGMMAAQLVPDKEFYASNAESNMNAAMWVAVVGLVLGAVLASWDSITAQAWPRAGRTALVGGLTGVIAGAIGGYAANALYLSMLDDLDLLASQSDIEGKVLLARVVGWGLFGVILGGGLGIPWGAKKIVNGLIGGAIGGAVGGFAFEQMELSGDFTSVSTLQFVGLVITGTGIGLAIGLVDRLTRQAWLEFSAGPLRGREVILFKERTTIGSAPTCDVALANDPGVAPLHLAVVVQPGGVVLQPSGAVAVNGSPMAGPATVRMGDQVTIGRSAFTVRDRAAPR